MTFAYRYPTFLHLFVQYSIQKLAAGYKSQSLETKIVWNQNAKVSRVYLRTTTSTRRIWLSPYTVIRLVSIGEKLNICVVSLNGTLCEAKICI